MAGAQTGALAAVFFAGMALGAVAESRPPLPGGLFGDWQGSGEIASSYDALTQPGRCRIEIEPQSDPGDVVISGTCAVTSGRAHFALRTVTDAQGRVRAAATVQGFEGTAQYAGTATAARIELSSRGSVGIGDRRFASRIVIERLDEGRFRMSQWLAPEGSADARRTVALEFARRGVKP